MGGGVSIGRNCKIQNYACLYEGVTLEDGVFVGPAAVFTNDRFPRAVNPDGTLKLESDWEQGRTVVSEGAAIGAGAVVLPGLAIGAWSLIAAGSVVVRNVKPHSLVRGNPAQHQGWVCRCARPLRGDLTCKLCGFRYEETANGLVESPIAAREE